MYNVGSLYAGVGGVCLGFIQAGFKLEWANEFDKFACETYRENFKHSLHEEDIWKLDPKKLPKVDVIVGGFPCQPFSIAGYRKGFEDERGNHFFRIIQYVKVHKPKVVLLENVKNLASHDNGNTFKVIKETLENFNYNVYYKVMNTKDFTEIPQNRERVIIVAIKKTIKEQFTFPEIKKVKTKFKDVLEKNLVDEKFYYRSDKLIFNELKNNINKEGVFYQWRRHYVRENKSGVCPTLTANMGTGGHNVPLIYTKQGIRKLTPRECFNIQGFPKNYKLPKISNAHLYKQSGNSVTVPLIKMIAERILVCLK
jgi:DNA (cytosine-5)-methyltransferase 1